MYCNFFDKPVVFERAVCDFKHAVVKINFEFFIILIFRFFDVDSFDDAVLDDEVVDLLPFCGERNCTVIIIENPWIFECSVVQILPIRTGVLIIDTFSFVNMPPSVKSHFTGCALRKRQCKRRVEVDLNLFGQSGFVFKCCSAIEINGHLFVLPHCNISHVFFFNLNRQSFYGTIRIFPKLPVCRKLIPAFKLIMFRVCGNRCKVERCAVDKLFLMSLSPISVEIQRTCCCPAFPIGAAGVVDNITNIDIG